MQTNNIT